MRGTRSTVSFLVCALLSAPLAACGDASAGGRDVEVADSSGVTLVRNLEPDLAIVTRSEAVLSLGGKETEEESFFQVGSWNVDTDRDGNVYVLDLVTSRVQVFDSRGRHVRSMGGKGEGPGELQWAFALAASADGRVRVMDVGKRAFVQWGPGGEVEEADPVPEGYRGGEVEWMKGGMALVLQDRETGADRLVLASPSGETATLATSAAVELKPITLESCGMGFSGMGPIFAPSLVWTAEGNTVVVTRAPGYVLDVFDGGRLVRSIRLEVPARAATAELAKASLGEGMRIGTPDGERVCDPDEVVEKRGFAPVLPAVAKLALAPDGTVWAQRFAVGDEPLVIDLFDPEGRYVGRLPEGFPFPVGFLPDGRLLTSEKDELDVERLVVRTWAVERP